MRKRVACKVIGCSYWVEHPPYKGTTLDLAVARLCHVAGKGGRWHAPSCRRKHNPHRVQFRPAPPT